MMYQLNPCLYCSKVPDPRNCDNKKCRPWQIWFSRRWDDTRKHFCSAMEQATVHDDGVPLGGYRYSQPERVREYLSQCPCMRCQLPRELCEVPCPVLLAWTKRKEQFYELEN